jgi:serine/threonine protein kinase
LTVLVRVRACDCARAQWMAPETLTKHGRLSEASDVYSYGVLLFEICARQVRARVLEGIRACVR